MNEDIFYRLAPFIKEYIYTNNWTELRAIQIEACKTIFNTDSHLLLAAGTASGKTEAAFLPILTLLTEDPPLSIGVLYIGPLKALINDQFYRLNHLLKESNIHVYPWHGDVSQSLKNKLIKNPRGVLQITPESLESLLINKKSILSRFFYDLRFIIIDEIHVFMSSDRGYQLLCQLERLNNYCKNEPRRIGLSATLGDYTQAENWLKANSNKIVVTPRVSGGSQKIRLAVEHFSIDETIQANSTITDYYDYIYKESINKKCLIFTNSRTESETVISNLRELSEKARKEDVYHTHHGSISKELREAAEKAMKEEKVPAVTAATVTLELGIDIGELDRAIQLGPTYSVSSFRQRLGRTGRRNNSSEMIFVTQEQADIDGDLTKQTPWNLLQTIAIIQLTIEDQWVEPAIDIKYPFSLLYHQTMSILKGYGECSPKSLAQKVLSLSAFRHISPNDYKELLLHLLEINHLEKTEVNNLIIGLEAEKIVNNFKFYAVFEENKEYKVKEAAKEIGSIHFFIPQGERFLLAGRTWEVVDVDEKGMIIFVKRVKGKSTISWVGSGGIVHNRILEKMRAILFEDTKYSYLGVNALNRLEEARNLAKRSNLDTQNIVHLGGMSYCIFPWCGSLEFDTLRRFLIYSCLSLNDKNISVASDSPYFIKLNIKSNNIDAIRETIKAIDKVQIDPEMLANENESLIKKKYDRFIPNTLLRKAFIKDYIDIDKLKDLCRKLN